jgi:hypothetical protein
MGFYAKPNDSQVTPTHGPETGTGAVPGAAGPRVQASTAPRNDPEYVAYLERRIAALEARMPRTNLLSDQFWTRAWAVYGHVLAVGLVASIVATVVYFALAGVFISSLAAVFRG